MSDANPYEPPKEVNSEASVVRFPGVVHALRFLLPATGAFLLGVYPGMYFLRRFIATRPHWTSVSEGVFLIILFGFTGAGLGLALFRLASWTKPVASDAIVVGGLIVAASLMGFVVSVFLGT